MVAPGCVGHVPTRVEDRSRKQLCRLARVRLEGRARRPADRGLDVALDDLLARPVGANLAVLYPECPPAELSDRAEIVAHEDDRPTLAPELGHLAHALLAERSEE